MFISKVKNKGKGAYIAVNGHSHLTATVRHLPYGNWEGQAQDPLITPPLG